MIDLAPGPLGVGEQLPAACGRLDLMRAFDLSVASFYRALHKHEFDRFLMERPIGRRRWSGALIMRHLSGEFESHAFGQKSRRAALHSVSSR